MSRPPLLHICNTFFETEIENPKEKPLLDWMRSHPIVRKLQTLPLLYASPEDLVLVSDLPRDPDPRLRLINESIDGSAIEHWGASRAIKVWAEKQNIPYAVPDWETVRTVNSKAFSFTHSPKLPFAALLHNETEALAWIEKTPGPKVLKTAFGTAGRGHFHIQNSKDVGPSLKREFAKNLPLIGEPWVERILDFSTQWKDAKFVGATVFENTSKGSYRATLAGPSSKIFGLHEWALDEHLAIVAPLLEKIQSMGFFGNLGIDAYIYRWEGKETLQPVVEINGRKTMSWAALQIQEKKYPGRCLKFSFSPGDAAPFHEKPF